MDKQNAITKKKLKSIETVEEFKRLLDNLMASEEEKEILILHYKEEKSLGYIADKLGLSESSIKNKHKKLLHKIGKII